MEKGHTLYAHVSKSWKASVFSTHLGIGVGSTEPLGAEKKAGGDTTEERTKGVPRRKLYIKGNKLKHINI